MREGAKMTSEKQEIVQQTRAAFDLIQKLYLEISYLIKEVEGLLREEDEKFIIGRPSGYAVTCRSSTGLETGNVNQWLMRKFSVCFIPEDLTKTEKGQTFTDITSNLKVIYMRFTLTGKEIDEPEIQFGVLHSVEKKPNAKWLKKFEHLMGHLEYNSEKIFNKTPNVDYSDAYVSVKGRLHKSHLFDIKDSETIVEKIIKPCLKIYRSI